MTLKQGYKAYQISQEFIEDFKEKSKEKSTDPTRRGSSAQREALARQGMLYSGDSSRLGSGSTDDKDNSISSGGEKDGGSRRLSKSHGKHAGGEGGRTGKSDNELRKMDTEL